MRLSIVFFLISVLLFGCQTDPINPSENAEVSAVYTGEDLAFLPSIQQEMYAFDSYKQYWECREAMTEALQVGKHYEDVLSEVGEFYSIAEAYEDITDDDYDKISHSFVADGSLAGFEGIITVVPDQGREFREEEIVVDPILRHLLNQHGMIQIGDSVWKHLFSYVVVVPVSEELALASLKDLTESSLADFGYPYTLHQVERDIISSNQYYVRGQVAECIDEYTSGNKDKRVKGILRWYSKSGGAQGYSGQTKHARKTWAGIWVGEKISELTVIGSGTVEWGGTTVTVDFSKTDNNKSKTAQYSFSQCSFCLRGDADIQGSHECSCSADCSTSYTYND